MKENTIVIILCNHGHSEILMNFVCNARRRGLDLKPILIFAIDPETKELAEGMGLTAFYDDINYGGIPSEAAQVFGDERYGRIILAKLLCVHTISMLGVDFLFQDVDVLWKRDPLEFFLNLDGATGNFDIYFQDDGSRGLVAGTRFCLRP